MATRLITKALGGKEDLLLGVGSSNQTRNGEVVAITKINGDNLPYEGNTEGVDLFSINDMVQAPLKRGVWDFSEDGGAIGDIALMTIPDNSTIINAWYEVVTPITADPSATIALGVDGDDAVGILAATAFDDSIFDAGYHDTLVFPRAANFTTKSTAKRNVVLTIGTAPLTAGLLYLWCQYITSS